MALLGLGRSSEPALLVLVSLLEGPKHGYAIRKDIERLTGRRLGPGTLYGAISRLEEAALIEAQAEDARRKPYGLTAAGRSEAQREVGEMAALASEGRRRLEARPA
jgi:DNA-binding PadR family transcriptional regulator